MIEILDDSFKVKAMGDTLTLDRAVVAVFGIDLREGRRGSPSLRADIIYGVEKPDGAFQAFDYEASISMIPKYVEALEWADNINKAHQHPKAQANGADVIFNMILWAEQMFVTQGMFGQGATVNSSKKPKPLQI